MERPPSLWEQYLGKAHAEGARGSGQWPVQPHPCPLEPLWEPFAPRELTLWDAYFNNWQAPWEGSWWKRLLFSPAPLFRPDDRLLVTEAPDRSGEKLAHIVVEQFPEDESTIPLAEIFLRSLPVLTAPVAFEMLGMGAEPQFDHDVAMEILKAGQKERLREAIKGWTEPYVKTQFVTHPADAQQVLHQLLSQYPNSAVLQSDEDDDMEDWTISGHLHGDDYTFGTLALRVPYYFKLREFTKIDPDPLGVVLSAMDYLQKEEWALLQIRFEPAVEPWADNIYQALLNPFKPGKYWFEDVNERLLRDKFTAPLFAVSIRLAASSFETVRHLIGWAEQFTLGPQGLEPFWLDEEADFVADAYQYRRTHRPGILLNAGELASLVHLPGATAVSERLKRVKTRTRPVIEADDGPGTVLLGENVHRGITKPARIPAELRGRHCYVAGGSGTGKSTLLLNMILQDIQAGEGVGVLDPHGDLINDILRYIPEERIDDVILFDPSDEKFPFALNMLEASDKSECERIVAETVMSLERFFPASWGPRLERILTFTLYSVLEAIPGATLADVERMLTDPRFRDRVVANLKEPRLIDYWQNQFRFTSGSAVDPVLNKLSVFLLNKTVRNIICQRHSMIDFDHILNGGKIFLANLSTGKMTEKVAGTLGSFLVTKMVNAAFRRASIPEEERKFWYLYVDEFQSFMNLSIGFEQILVGARKYRLVLAGMANQYVGQLTSAVRQAVFGNVGTMVTFRLGVDDATTVGKDIGVFTSEEILNLGMGEAFVRIERGANTYNLKTFPKPPPPEVDPTPRIVEMTRSRYCRPVAEVEAEVDGMISDRVSREEPFKFKPQPEDPSEEAFIT